MRRNLEAEALREFAAIASEKGLRVFFRQGKTNRLTLSGNNYFQFGDLRVETDTRTVLIEVESAGGVTNLAKYWYWIRDVAGDTLSKPIALIHIFQQNSDNDYVAHLQLWDFLEKRITRDVGGKFTARRFCYKDASDLAPALDEFRRLLAPDGNNVP